MNKDKVVQKRSEIIIDEISINNKIISWKHSISGKIILAAKLKY